MQPMATARLVSSRARPKSSWRDIWRERFSCVHGTDCLVFCPTTLLDGSHRGQPQEAGLALIYLTSALTQRTVTARPVPVRSIVEWYSAQL